MTTLANTTGGHFGLTIRKLPDGVYAVLDDHGRVIFERRELGEVWKLVEAAFTPATRGDGK